MQRMDPYSRHKKFINDYVLTLGKEGVQRYIEKNRPCVGKTDLDVLHENYKFVRNPEEDDLSKWEVRMAVKYYEKLYKEYCIADMSKYKKGQIALRWRAEKEVFVGKGQFVCGNQVCTAKDELQSFEMNFAYKEGGEKKNALVKLRVCPDCAIKLNYKKLRKMEKEMKKKAKKEKKRMNGGEAQAQDQQSSSSESESDESEEDQEDDGEWEEVTSRSTGKTYWFNKETGESKWDRPQARKRKSRGEGDHDAAGRESLSSQAAEKNQGEQLSTNERKASKEEPEKSLDNSIWSRPAQVLEDAAIGEDEFDEYFKGMFP